MTEIENGPVRPHVQAFADEANARFGTIVKTYNGHQPDRELALDCWDSIEDRRELAQFARDNYARFGIDYVIHEQRIWNPEILDSWRWMADRNSPTANHFDHVHVSFNETGEARPSPAPTPDPPDTWRPMLAMGDRGPDVRYLQERLIAHGHSLGEYGADGIFGPITRARVQIHQAAWHLVPDGIVGRITWPTLIVDLPK